MIVVTTHAIERFIQRAAPYATVDEARSTIEAAAPVIEVAAAFGCRTVKMACGARLVLEGDHVVTVLPPARPIKARALVAGRVGR